MKVYPIGLAGESNYQPAIERTHRGEAVKVCHEADNPHDAFALVVENNIGEPIGYIPKSSWLHRAIHEDGRGVAGTVKSISKGAGQVYGVVIDVTVTDDPVFSRSFHERAQRDANHARPAASSGGVGSFLRGLFGGIK